MNGESPAVSTDDQLPGLVRPSSCAWPPSGTDSAEGGGAAPSFPLLHTTRAGQEGVFTVKYSSDDVGEGDGPPSITLHWEARSDDGGYDDALEEMGCGPWRPPDFSVMPMSRGRRLEVRYTSQRAGVFHLSVGLKHERVKRSAVSVVRFSVEVLPEERASAACCTVRGLGLSQASSSSSYSYLYLTAADRLGNRVMVGGEDVDVFVVSHGGRQVEGSVVDSGEGHYEATYRVVPSPGGQQDGDAVRRRRRKRVAATSGAPLWVNRLPVLRHRSGPLHFRWQGPHRDRHASQSAGHECAWREEVFHLRGPMLSADTVHLDMTGTAAVSEEGDGYTFRIILNPETTLQLWASDRVSARQWLSLLRRVREEESDDCTSVQRVRLEGSALECVSPVLQLFIKVNEDEVPGCPWEPRIITSLDGSNITPASSTPPPVAAAAAAAASPPPSARLAMMETVAGSSRLKGWDKDSSDMLVTRKGRSVEDQPKSQQSHCHLHTATASPAYHVSAPPSRCTSSASPTATVSTTTSTSTILAHVPRLRTRPLGPRPDWRRPTAKDRPLSAPTPRSEVVRLLERDKQQQQQQQQQAGHKVEGCDRTQTTTTTTAAASDAPVLAAAMHGPRGARSSRTRRRPLETTKPGHRGESSMGGATSKYGNIYSMLLANDHVEDTPSSRSSSSSCSPAALGRSERRPRPPGPSTSQPSQPEADRRRCEDDPRCCPDNQEALDTLNTSRQQSEGPSPLPTRHEAATQTTEDAPHGRWRLGRAGRGRGGGTGQQQQLASPALSTISALSRESDTRPRRSGGKKPVKRQQQPLTLDHHLLKGSRKDMATSQARASPTCGSVGRWDSKCWLSPGGCTPTPSFFDLYPPPQAGLTDTTSSSGGGGRQQQQQQQPDDGSHAVVSPEPPVSPSSAVTESTAASVSSVRQKQAGTIGALPNAEDDDHGGGGEDEDGDDHHNAPLADAHAWGRLCDWLANLEMRHYIPLFRQQGLTRLSSLELLTGNDLVHIGVHNEAERQTLLRAIADFSLRTRKWADDALSSQQPLQLSQEESSTHSRQEQTQPRRPVDTSPWSSGGPLLLLLHAFDVRDYATVLRLFFHMLPAEARQDTSHPLVPVWAALEFHLHLYAATDAAQGDMISVFESYVDSRSGQLPWAKMPAFCLYAGLPSVRDPRTHPVFAPLYKPAWASALRERLRLFIELIVAPEPMNQETGSVASPTSTTTPESKTRRRPRRPAPTLPPRCSNGSSRSADQEDAFVERK